MLRFRQFSQVSFEKFWILPMPNIWQIQRLGIPCVKKSYWFVMNQRCGWGTPSSEIDISVSKLLGFETFAKSLRVSVSENLVSEKKSQFWFRKNWSGKKVSVSVSENRVSEEKYRFRFRKNLVSEKSLGFGKFGTAHYTFSNCNFEVVTSCLTTFAT